jgi:hypothetical protein
MAGKRRVARYWFGLWSEDQLNKPKLEEFPRGLKSSVLPSMMDGLKSVLKKSISAQGEKARG